MTNVRTPYFHGGLAGLRPRQKLLPATKTGTTEWAGDELLDAYSGKPQAREYDRRFVHVAADVEAATKYAWYYAMRRADDNRAAVYKVIAFNARRHPADPADVYVCDSAIIIAVIEELEFTPATKPAAVRALLGEDR